MIGNFTVTFEITVVDFERNFEYREPVVASVVANEFYVFLPAEDFGTLNGFGSEEKDIFFVVDDRLTIGSNSTVQNLILDWINFKVLLKNSML